MFSSNELPSPSSLFSAYASLAASMMLIRTMANDLIPQPARGYIFSAIGSLFKSRSSNLTLTLEEFHGITKNQIYEASEAYLSTKISPDTDALKISKTPKEKHFVVELEHGEKIVDFYEGVHVRWDFHSVESDGKDRNSGENPTRSERKFFKLSFEKKHKDFLLSSYLPHILEKAQSIKDEQRGLKLFTLCNYRSYGGGTKWDSINFEHPANFEILAMDPELKKEIIEDLDRFVKRKDFYRRVGKAWKRGYLLYGPPGTGKSSLVAAMANYLKFNIYDLQLNNIMTDSDLRRLLLTTGNKSILVIEDIDCSVEFTRGENVASSGPDFKKPNLMLTLSGLLNFIDGLWSSCGDERIIVFTTNEKDKLDPALLRPGRMDMHIHMSYCKFPGFKTLASNYIGPPRSRNRGLYGEIEGMIKTVEVTPAEIAEELMKSEDADVALNGVVRLLKRKKMEGADKVVENENEKVGVESAAGEIKRAKLDNGVNVVNSALDA